MSEDGVERKLHRLNMGIQECYRIWAGGKGVGVMATVHLWLA
jgi:hypothetical protein